MHVQTADNSSVNCTHSLFCGSESAVLGSADNDV